MKKIFLLLSLILMLGVSAHAEELKDIQNYNFEKEILTLNVLNIIDGDENGYFHPMELVKRSEAAELIVTAFSYDGFQCGQTETEFNDVPKEHWASGYIATAADMGFINGMGDGSFAPDDEITFEQACTIIVKALGYEPMAENYGGYPYGYIRYASELELADKLSLEADAPVTKGALAYMLAQSMEAPTVEFVVAGSMAWMNIMHGRGADYLCPMIKYHNAYSVSGYISATSRSNSSVPKGYVDLNINYARRLGMDFINTAMTVRCKTVDGEAVYDALFLSGDFILKETDDEEYTIIMIVL